jgi:transcriptional regulator with XRE-family HTH domain
MPTRAEARRAERKGIKPVTMELVRDDVVPRKETTRAPQRIDAYVGERIRFRRNLLGVTQTEMADRIGVTFQQLQKYEKGVNRIGASRLMQICKALEVTPEWLFEGAPGGQPNTATRDIDTAFAAFQADDLAPRLLLVWNRLSNPIKRSMLQLMSAVAAGEEK